LSFMVATNDARSLPISVGGDERRFLILESTGVKNNEVFNALDESIKNKRGLGSILGFLLRRDISNFNKKPPITKALVRQIVRAFNPLQKDLVRGIFNGSFCGYSWEGDSSLEIPVNEMDNIYRGKRKNFSGTSDSVVESMNKILAINDEAVAKTVVVELDNIKTLCYSLPKIETLKEMVLNKYPKIDELIDAY